MLLKRGIKIFEKKNPRQTIHKHKGKETHSSQDKRKGVDKFIEVW